MHFLVFIFNTTIDLTFIEYLNKLHNTIDLNNSEIFQYKLVLPQSNS